VEAPSPRLPAGTGSEESQRHLHWPADFAAHSRRDYPEVRSGKGVPRQRHDESPRETCGLYEVTSEKNGFIAVSVTDKDKKRVAEMANAYTDELRILTKTLAVTEASQRRFSMRSS